jgi:hypothetical protein
MHVNLTRMENKCINRTQTLFELSEKTCLKEYENHVKEALPILLLMNPGIETFVLWMPKQKTPVTKLSVNVDGFLMLLVSNP